MPLAMAVFLVFGGLLFGVFPLSGGAAKEGRSSLDSDIGIIPLAQGAEIEDNAALNVQDASFFAVAPSNAVSAVDQGSLAGAYAENAGMVHDAGASLGASRNRSEIVTYIVQKKDTLGSIASYFGISTETVLAANPNIQLQGVRAGEVIKILPTSGVLYESGIGDTLSSISKIFNVSATAISQYNPSVSFSSLQPGTSVVIPNQSASGASSLATG